MDRFGQAARTAALKPQTWIPLLGAGLLQVDNLDQKWSQDLADDRPLFGDDAADVSDDLRDAATGAYVLSALFTESDSWGAKGRGLAVGAGTMLLDGAVNQGLKDLSKRQRPNGSNDQSMPSGHASKASSRTNMAITNLDHVRLAPWQRQGLSWMLHGVAVGTGLARVEAEKHYLGDVLVGYAMGHFVSTFMYEAFMQDNPLGAQLTFVPVAQGGALRLTLPLK